MSEKECNAVKSLLDITFENVPSDGETTSGKRKCLSTYIEVQKKKQKKELQLKDDAVTLHHFCCLCQEQKASLTLYRYSGSVTDIDLYYAANGANQAFCSICVTNDDQVCHSCFQEKFYFDFCANTMQRPRCPGCAFQVFRCKMPSEKIIELPTFIVPHSSEFYSKAVEKKIYYAFNLQNDVWSIGTLDELGDKFDVYGHHWLSFLDLCEDRIHQNFQCNMPDEREILHELLVAFERHGISFDSWLPLFYGGSRLF